MRLLPLALTATLMTAACTGSPANPAALGGAPGTFKGGETIPVEIGSNGKVAYRATLRTVRLEAPGLRTQQVGSTDDLALVLDSETFVDPAFKAVITPNRVVSDKQLDQFLNEQWDAYMGGKDDPGRQGKEFRDFLVDLGLNIDDFLALHQDLGLPLSKLMDVCRICQTYGKTMEGPDAKGFLTVLDTLQAVGLTPKQFLGAIAESGLSVNTVFQRLGDQKLPLSEFLDDVTTSGTRLPDAIKALPAFRSSVVSSQLWDKLMHYSYPYMTFRSGAPTGETGFLLPVGSDPKDVEVGCVGLNSTQRWLIIGNSSNPLLLAEWRLKANVNCSRPDSPRGSFVQQVGMEYPKYQEKAGWNLMGKMWLGPPYREGRNGVAPLPHDQSHWPGIANNLTTGIIAKHRVIGYLINSVCYVWEEQYKIDATTRPGTIREETISTHETVWAFGEVLSGLLTQ